MLWLVTFGWTELGENRYVVMAASEAEALQKVEGLIRKEYGKRAASKLLKSLAVTKSDLRRKKNRIARTVEQIEGDVVDVSYWE